MSITTNLPGDTSHRPWKLPEGRWKYYQEWNKALFLHWEVNPDILEPLIPSQLELDIHRQSAWVSVVIFRMERIRPFFLPSFPPVSNFGEINIRTYVTIDDKPGVYFLSIEGEKAVSCMLAKLISGLPYRLSKIIIQNENIQSTNELTGDSLSLEFETGEVISNKNQTDAWLTERYALYLDKNDSICKYEIHHPEWKLNEVRLNRLQINYPRFNHFLKNTPVKMHYSKGVQVAAWGREKIR